MTTTLTQQQNAAAHDVDTSSMRGFYRAEPARETAPVATPARNIYSESMAGVPAFKPRG